ncbi:hypothetical protein [Kiloniella litopenaei]|uniref:hypothetical protein n=1 Tax=Kiloniella litopenaei TaxID=1549748 RepID=UPI003BAD206D
MHVHHSEKDNQNDDFVEFSDLFDDIVPFYEVNKNRQSLTDNKHHLLDEKTRQYLLNSIIDIHEFPIKL